MSTVCAIATPNGVSALAVIRVSGPDTEKILKKIFLKQPSEISPKRIYRSFLYHPETKKIVDEVTFVFYREPASYTGEDMLEIVSHGGYIVPKFIEETIIKAGASPALL